MRRIVAAGLALAPLVCGAQAPRPERLEGCRDALLVSAERYDLPAGLSGQGGGVDGVRCAANADVYTAGAARYSVAGSHWSLARGGASRQWRDGLWASIDGSAGAGRNAAGSFNYFTVRDAVTWRAGERWFAKLEHQYIDIATDHGHVARLAASALAGPSILIELAAARAVGGNLGTRNYSARIDAVGAAGRLFAGVAHGRTTPQAVDIITGHRLPDAITRQGFAGGALPVGRGELLLGFDHQATAGARRRTWSVALRWPLP